MNDFAMRVLAAPLGRTYLFSVGQAGFILKSKRGQLLAIDLYLSECVERVEGNIGFKRLLPKILSPFDLTFDVVIATHPHKDHFDIDAVPELMSNPTTQLFASPECRNLLRELEMTDQNVTYVKPGDQATVGDFKMTFINCDHGTGAPDAVGVVVEVDDKRILEVGDTCLRLDRTEEYLSQGTLDVLIAPINGAFGNLTEVECAQLADALKPRVTIPCHYGMFASHGGNPGVFYKEMTECYPYHDFLIMAQGEQFAIE